MQYGKPLAVAAFLGLSSLLSGCPEGGFATEFVVPEQVIDGAPRTARLREPLDGPVTFAVDINAEAARLDATVRSARLQGFTLAITDTACPEKDADDFDFVDRIQIYIQSTRAGSTLPRVLVADLQDVARGTETLSLNIDGGVELLHYIREGAVLTASMRGRRPPDDVSVVGRMFIRGQVF